MDTNRTMASWRSVRFLLFIAAVSMGLLLALAPAVPASVARFGCRASAGRASYLSAQANYEPTLVGSTPCADGSRIDKHPQASGSFRIGTAEAFIHRANRDEAPGAGTLAAAANVQVSGSGDSLEIATAQSGASFACARGSSLGSSASEVTGLVVDGRAVALSKPSTPERVPFGSHGSYVEVNKVVETSTSLTRTAAFVHMAGVGDFVVAESIVTERPNACLGTRGFVPAVGACPAGAVYDPASNRCLITAFTRRPIFVSTPFGGPTGATVYAVRHARAVLKGSHCLGRGGPPFVLVGSISGLIVGTPHADRIVTLPGNYTIHGSGGEDCISAGRGTNVIRDGNADVRIYGGDGRDEMSLGNGRDTISLGSGTNVIAVGNGNDSIQGGPGRNTIRAGNGLDRITVRGPGINRVTVGSGTDYIRGGAGINVISAGDGNDTIIGGPGFDVISAGRGADSITAGPGIDRISAGAGKDTIRSAVGFDRITASGPGAQVTCVDKALVVLNPAAVPYARAHGCRNVR